MEKLRRNAGLEARCVYGFRVSRFLAIRKAVDLKAHVDRATDLCVSTSRAVEDLERPVQEAIADRIVADANLDDTARVVARRLAARGARAEKEKPYTDVLPKGLGEYTEAKQEDEVYLYGRMAARIEEHLAVDDPVRVELVPQLRAQIAAWKAADEAVDAAEGAQQAAREARNAAVVAWEQAIDHAYGQLVSRIGKAEAEKCFPKGTTKRKAPAAADVPDAEGCSSEPTDEASE